MGKLTSIPPAIKEMTGYFWKTKDVNAFGAFTPSLGTGLYHIADEKIASGIKLWSYGTADDSAWSVLSTAKHQTYIEIQGGPIGDQSIKLEMLPKQKRWHVEYWIPTDKEMEIRKMKTPSPVLRSIDEIPLFSWARKEDGKDWETLINTYKSKKIMNLRAPDIYKSIWPPSGLENLDEPFKLAIKYSGGENQDNWKFYYGTWLAGRGDTVNAINILSKTNLGIAKLLLARLYKLQGKMQMAKNEYDHINEKWLQLHPQVVVERDKVLRALGPTMLAEREHWLSKVEALKDEWIIERKVQLLIDKGEYLKAKELLLATSFQKVHQTYTRTGLWMQICEKLNIPCSPIPLQLGEDRLATFGAYREYE